jgi:hypothetical protein
LWLAAHQVENRPTVRLQLHRGERECVPGRRRTRALALVSAGLACATLAVAGGASANAISISGNMEGNIKIANGDYISAGYSFSVPGAHPDALYKLSGASVTIEGTCSNGGTGSVVIPFSSPSTAYVVPANNSHWFPTDEASSTDSYQGSVVAAGLCGGTGNLSIRKGGATFTADVHSTDIADPIHFRFHYRDPNAKGKGNIDCRLSSPSAGVCGAGWSASRELVPDFAKATPSITTSGTGTLGGDLIIRLSDQAALAGAFEPTGTVSYTVFGPFDLNCVGPPIDAVQTLLLQNGNVPPSNTFMVLPTTDPVTGTVLPRFGVYEFVAHYSGDAFNEAADSTCGDDAFHIVG